MTSTDLLACATEGLYALIVDDQVPTAHLCTGLALVRCIRPWAEMDAPPVWHELTAPTTDWQRELIDQLSAVLHSEEPAIAWSNISPTEVIAVAFSHRTPGGLDFDQLAMLRNLEPHLVRATRLRQRLQLRNSVLDSICEGIVFTDAKGHISFCNESARQILLSSASPMSVEQGVLRVTSDHGADLSLRQAIASTAISWDPAPDSLELALNQSSGEPGDYRVRVAPMRRAHQLGHCGPDGCAVIFISDLNRGLGRAETWLQSAYQLTPTEAKVATHLANGLTLDSVAETLGVKPNTVKSHLKSIFGKMDLHRQSDLVRTIALGCGSSMDHHPTDRVPVN